MIRYCSLFLLIVSFTLPSLASDLPQPFFKGSLAQVQAKALESQTPYVVYVYQPKSRLSRKMLKKTWPDRHLSQFLDNKFITWGYDVLSAQPGVDLVQQFHVYTYPSTLIFSPEGQLMGKAEGYVAPTTLAAILAKHLHKIELRRKEQFLAQQAARRIHPATEESSSEAEADKHTSPTRTTESAKTAAQETAVQMTRSTPPKAEPTPVPKAIPSTIPPKVEDIGLLSGAVATRGQMNSILHLDVPGMESFSLKSLAQNAEASLGLLMGSYTSYQQLQGQVKRFDRIWKGEVWVFCEEVDEIPVYKLVLGTYPTREEAEIFAHSIYKFEKVNPSILDLARLVH